MPDRLPTYFISHGGGPWPWIKDLLPVDCTPLEASLRAIADEIGVAPRAVLVVSAHWEEPHFTVQSHANPPMLYDYGGFPAHTYEITYPAPGAPDVAVRVADLLRGAGIAAHTDSHRGFDHGTFVPLYCIYPHAQVPVLQLSLRAGLDPSEHLDVGRALAPLRDEGVLIVASGFPSFHNGKVPGAGPASLAFDAWLTDTLVHSDPARRVEHLLAWEHAPAARIAHPREEHFIPGLVAVGAAEHDAGAVQYHEDEIMGWMTSSSYRFGIGAG